MSGGRRPGFGRDGPPPTLVLLPGIVGDAGAFARQSPLRRWGPVVALDLPADPGLERVDSIAGALLPALPTGQLVLLGVSLGALVARSLARALGSRVRGVVGVGALPHPRHVPRSLRVARPALGALPRGVARRAWRVRLSRAMAREDIPVQERERLLHRLPSAAVALARLDAVLHLSHHPGPAPAAWLRGQLDVEAPWTVADAVRDLPGACVAPLPGGHRAHWTHPEPFNEMALAWWRRLASPTG